MSAATMDRIQYLASSRHHHLAPDQVNGLRPLTEAAQQAILRHLEGCPVRHSDAHPAQPEANRFEGLPPLRHFAYLKPGLYATPAEEEGKIDFWRVRREEDEKSKWHGWNFIDRVTGGVGSLSYYDIKGEQARRALLGIEQYGPEASEILAATKLERCRRCHSPLTNDLSRKRLYGPECWDKKDED